MSVSGTASLDNSTAIMYSTSAGIVILGHLEVQFELDLLARPARESASIKICQGILPTVRVETIACGHIAYEHPKRMLFS